EMIYMSYVPYHLILYFFFQAEDGIRDFHVTGVQTCALPISACCECRHRRRQVLSSVSSKARRLAMLVSRSVFESCSSLACCWRAVYTSSLKALRNWRRSFTRSGEENNTGRKKPSELFRCNKLVACRIGEVSWCNKTANNRAGSKIININAIKIPRFINSGILLISCCSSRQSTGSWLLLYTQRGWLAATSFIGSSSGIMALASIVLSGISRRPTRIILLML